MHKFGNKILSKDVLIISDIDKTYTFDETIAELKYLETLKAQIAEYGVKMIFEEVETEADLIKLLANYDKDKVIIFNWCERLYNKEGTERKAVKIYEELGFTFTGASSETLKLSANKYKSVELLRQNGVPVPDSRLVTKRNIEKLNINLEGDVILKSNALHASAGLHKDNVVNDKDQFHKVSNRIFEEVNTSVIAQRFIPGDEYTVVVWGNNDPKALPVIKIIYEDVAVGNIYTQNSKFNFSTDEYTNCKYDLINGTENLETYEQLQNIAIKAYKALGMKDYARIDIRCDDNEAYVIDVNANPYINVLSDTDSCEVFKCTEALGYNWGETILQICDFALERTE